MPEEPRPGDAFGEMLRAVLRHDGRPGEVFEVLERDDGHVRANDAARYVTPSWGPLDDWIHQRATGRVLDVGCGAGRNALVLQDAGLDVVGLDVSPGAVEVARTRGLTHVVEGTLDTADLTGTFDSFVLAGNNLGLLADRDTAPHVLRRLAELSVPGGRILATATGREPGSSLSEDDADYEARNLQRGRLRWQVTMRSRFGRLTTPWFEYLFLTLEELDDLIAGSRWRIADSYGQGASYAVQLERQ